MSSGLRVTVPRVSSRVASKDVVIADEVRFRPRTTEGSAVLHLSDSWVPAVGETLLFRVGEVVDGEFGPIMFADQWVPVKETTAGTLISGLLRLPGWLYKRAKERNVELVEGRWYLAELLQVVPTRHESPYNIALIIAVPDDLHANLSIDDSIHATVKPPSGESKLKAAAARFEQLVKNAGQ